jgi:hypothetical protein
MATENNKNIKYTSKNNVRPARRKLTDTNTINSIKGVLAQFINAVKVKHLS